MTVSQLEGPLRLVLGQGPFQFTLHNILASMRHITWHDAHVLAMFLAGKPIAAC